MYNRRDFVRKAFKAGLMGATASLWANSLAQKAFGQVTGGYKAMIMVSLVGGNDGNNLIIPMDSQLYSEYATLRSSIALKQTDCLPLKAASGTPAYGLHPALVNVAGLYNRGRASIVANVGPLSAPATKSQLYATPSLLPAQFLSHPAGRLQWATSSTTADSSSGWGGRLSDHLQNQSGQLPPFLNVSNASVFTVGEEIQAISVQANTVQYQALAGGMNEAILSIAKADCTSSNLLVAQAAKLRVRSMQQQVLIEQAQQYGQPLQTVFPNNPLGNSFKAIVQLMQGRTIVGANRQLYYCEQDGTYDTHGGQLLQQSAQLAELDGALGALMNGLEEIGLADSVIVCTSSDFNRTMQANSTIGTDHAWGNHQIVLGGSQGGRIIGSMPTLELGGSSDLGSQGIWIPNQSVTQMAAGIGAWMGLGSSDLKQVFPDLANFPSGALSF